MSVRNRRHPSTHVLGRRGDQPTAMQHQEGMYKLQGGVAQKWQTLGHRVCRVSSLSVRVGCWALTRTFYHTRGTRRCGARESESVTDPHLSACMEPCHGFHSEGAGEYENSKYDVDATCPWTPSVPSLLHMCGLYHCATGQGPCTIVPWSQVR
jgi:hypothetical protein